MLTNHFNFLLICYQGIFLASVFISVDAAGTTSANQLLECRICRNAMYLEECTETRLCSANEECYMEEILTAQYQIIFNAGCRSKTICNSAVSLIGKRADNADHVICSHCCNEPKMNTSLECNANLCGIKTNSDHSNQCYYCGPDEDARQDAVTDPRRCRKIKLCGNHEVCRVTTFNMGGMHSHEFGCHSLLACQILTIISLRDAHVDPHINIPHLVQTGEIEFNRGRKRQTTYCDVCCGDGLCNNDACLSVRRRLTQFVAAHRFNFTTLRIIP